MNTLNTILGIIASLMTILSIILGILLKRTKYEVASLQQKLSITNRNKENKTAVAKKNSVAFNENYGMVSVSKDDNNDK